MDEEKPVTESGAPREEMCPCEYLGDYLAAMLGIRSPEARQHLRNARIEMLKAIRATLDQRIEHLSRHSAKGTKIGVD